MVSVMGRSMCGHILAAGYPVTVFNRTKAKAHTLVERGAKWADSPQEVAAESDVVFSIVGYPEVLECYTMAGGSDYLLKVVAKDIAGYERFLRDQLLQRPHVLEAHSNIAMSEVKRTTELPLD